MLFSLAIQALDGAMSELGVGGNVMFLGWTVVSTVTHARSFFRNAPVLCDLIEPGSEQIARSRRLMLLWPHHPLRCRIRKHLKTGKQPPARLFREEQSYRRASSLPG